MSLWRLYLDLLFVLEAPFVDDDVLDSSSVSEPFLKHSVVLEQLLGLAFGNSVQSVFIDHTHSLELKQNEREISRIQTFTRTFLRDNLLNTDARTTGPSQEKNNQHNSLNNSFYLLTIFLNLGHTLVL